MDAVLEYSLLSADTEVLVAHYFLLIVFRKIIRKLLPINAVKNASLITLDSIQSPNTSKFPHAVPLIFISMPVHKKR